MLESTVHGQRVYEILYDTQAQLRSRWAVRGDVLNREQGTLVAWNRPGPAAGAWAGYYIIFVFLASTYKRLQQPYFGSHYFYD